MSPRGVTNHKHMQIGANRSMKREPARVRVQQKQQTKWKHRILVKTKKIMVPRLVLNLPTSRVLDTTGHMHWTDGLGNFAET
ncbi:hypothetical protein RHGRI_029145 [Rhododendron griersonianum]|uniref:Uncharacterized protein n=1 Tax=Rhododendron griersonianum TaxID=479676 RepID=A0AAV6ILG6_9ERIC|nr:hypothetical protein RHGRI_029145 [Rhododendron griersonianum]